MGLPAGVADVVRRSRTVPFAQAILERDELVPMFGDLLRREDFRGGLVLDVGTGRGRVALIVARRAGHVIGVDVDERGLSEARAYAAVRNLPRAEFVLGDAEVVLWSEWSRRPYDFVTANFFMSEPLVVRAGEYLRPGGRFLFCCHHTDHWRETGKGSRWAFDEARMAALLKANGFDVEFLGVDTVVVTFDTLAQVEQFLGERHVRKWTDDGRWDTLAAVFRSGAKQLTTSYLVGRARRRS